MKALREDANRLLDLNREFARRRENQGASGFRQTLGTETNDPGQDGQAECSRLARTGLGDAQNIPAFQLGRDRLCLDGLRVNEASMEHCFQQLAGNSEFREAILLRIDIIFQSFLLSSGRSHANRAAGRNLPQVILS